MESVPTRFMGSHAAMRSALGFRKFPFNFDKVLGCKVCLIKKALLTTIIVLTCFYFSKVSDATYGSAYAVFGRPLDSLSWLLYRSDLE